LHKVHPRFKLGIFVTLSSQKENRAAKCSISEHEFLFRSSLCKIFLIISL